MHPSGFSTILSTCGIISPDFVISTMLPYLAFNFSNMSRLDAVALDINAPPSSIGSNTNTGIRYPSLLTSPQSMSMIFVIPLSSFILYALEFFGLYTPCSLYEFSPIRTKPSQSYSC